MTKKSTSPYRRSTPGKRITAPEKPPVDRLATWIGQQSRLKRTLMVGMIALVMTLAIGATVYGFLLGLAPKAVDQLLIDSPNILTIILFILVIIGFGFYWVGWRYMIGFDFEDTVLEPGRGAALWLLTGS